MGIGRIGIVAIVVSAIVAFVAVSVSGAAVGVVTDIVSPRSACHGASWPYFPKSCPERADRRHVRSVAADATPRSAVAQKSDRLPIASKSGAEYETIVAHGDGVTVLTRVKRAELTMSTLLD